MGHSHSHSHSHSQSTRNDDDEKGALERKRTKVCVIAGATAIGKSSLGIALARALDGEVVSCDSVQIYQGLDVGSGKVSSGERATTRHHAIDLVRDVRKEYDAVEYAKDARAAIDEIASRGKVPIVVGGAGMYLRFLTDGAPSAPKSTAESKSNAKATMEAARVKGGWREACDVLRAAGDSVTPGKLSENDWYRLTRAYEIVVASGGRAVHEFAATPIDDAYDFRCFFLTAPRVELYRRIDSRVEDMVCDGMLEEAAAMLNAGVRAGECSASRAIGYRQSMEYLSLARAGEIEVNAETLLRFVDEAQQVTRAYAKRQYTWFRGEPEGRYLWIDASGDKDALARRVMDEFARDEHAGGGEEMSELSKAEENELKRYRAMLRRLNRTQTRDELLDRIRTRLM